MNWLRSRWWVSQLRRWEVKREKGEKRGGFIPGHIAPSQMTNTVVSPSWACHGLWLSFQSNCRLQVLGDYPGQWECQPIKSSKQRPESAALRSNKLPRVEFSRAFLADLASPSYWEEHETHHLVKLQCWLVLYILDIFSGLDCRTLRGRRETIIFKQIHLHETWMTTTFNEFNVGFNGPTVYTGYIQTDEIATYLWKIS